MGWSEETIMNSDPRLICIIIYLCPLLLLFITYLITKIQEQNMNTVIDKFKMKYRTDTVFYVAHSTNDKFNSIIKLPVPYSTLGYLIVNDENIIYINKWNSMKVKVPLEGFDLTSDIQWVGTSFLKNPALARYFRIMIDGEYNYFMGGNTYFSLTSRNIYNSIVQKIQEVQT